MHLVARCSKVYDDVSRIISDRDYNSRVLKQQPAAMELASKILTVIERAGYHNTYFCTNPNVQYSIAQFRQTFSPLDRIYGIMQLYGFRLGASNLDADDQPYSLEDKENEFARTLVKQFLLLSQRFIHSGNTTPEKSWRITQFSKVPQVLMELEMPQICCDEFSITDSNNAFIRGTACELEQLIDSWSRCAKNLDYLFT